MDQYFSFIWNFQKNGVTLKQPLQLLVSDNTKWIVVPAWLTFYLTFQAWTIVSSKKPQTNNKQNQQNPKQNKMPNKP